MEWSKQNATLGKYNRHLDSDKQQEWNIAKAFRSLSECLYSQGGYVIVVVFVCLSDC